jgi:hypothetical protein
LGVYLVIEGVKMKLQVIQSLALLSLLFTGCANRDQVSAVPTPTPGEMDVAYATPEAAATLEPEAAVPAPPGDAVAPVPTPTPLATLPPPPAEAPVAEEPVQPPPTPLPVYSRRSYIVQPGDSLWNISGKPVVLGDRFRWPLLFKANRGSIKDPDLIEPGLELTWKANYPMFEIEDAIEKSKDTPAYVPHAMVRVQLPIAY